MARRPLITVLLTCAALEVWAVPTNVTSAEGASAAAAHEPGARLESDGASLALGASGKNSEARGVLEKIGTSSGPRARPGRPDTAGRERPQPGPDHVIDQATADKIQELIDAIKDSLPQQTSRQHDAEPSSHDDADDQRYSKALKLKQNAVSPAVAMPYITSMPVLVFPQANSDLYPTNNALNAMKSDTYQTRQSTPSFPFQIQWPLASVFPILVKDPLLGFLHGGGWNNFFEIGQSADVCSRRKKQRAPGASENLFPTYSADVSQSIDDSPDTKRHLKRRSRVARSVEDQDRNVPAPKPADGDSAVSKSKKVLRPIITRKSTKKPQTDKEVVDTESSESEGELRFPFGDFTWFGNKKPVAPSPGFFINKMKVRRGGVAIAGPGGVATAGRGGTAIVGPGGLAYTQPGGLAVAGPAARVIALSPATDLSSLIARLHQHPSDGSAPRSFHLPPDGRLVATGPVVYYHPHEQT